MLQNTKIGWFRKTSICMRGSGEELQQSMYFNVFNASDKPFGGWFRIGTDPMRVTRRCRMLYLPDGRVGFMFSAVISHNNALMPEACGLKSSSPASASK